MTLPDWLLERVSELADSRHSTVTLLLDTQKSKDLLDSDDSQFARRLYIRTVFAYVEGAMHFMRREALAQHSLGYTEELSSAEVALLRQESYEINDKGRARTREYFGSLINNLRFVFACFSRTQGSDSKPEYGKEGWDSFRRAIKIRNRVTHPKQVDDLNISDDEVEDVDRALQWFHDSFGQALEIGTRRAKSNLEGWNGVLDSMPPSADVERIEAEMVREFNKYLTELGLTEIQVVPKSSKGTGS